MSDTSVENRRYETYGAAKAATGVWRICHPRSTMDCPWYVAFLPDQVVSRDSLCLISNATPPDDALQFGRERDARFFAAAFLAPDLIWQFVQDKPAVPAPPVWMEGDPELMGDFRGVAAPATPAPVDWWNHPRNEEERELARTGGQGR